MCPINLHGLLYNQNSKNLRLFDKNPFSDLPINNITQFLKEGTSHVWLTSKSGMYLFDIDQMKFVSRLSSDDISSPLSDNTIFSLLRLSPKKILVGTNNFLDLVDFTLPYFQNISKDLKGRHILNDNVVFSILKDENGLWVGTADGGLNLIQDDQKYYYREDQNDPNGISGSIIRKIVKDEINQRMWFATDNGLSVIDLKNFEPNRPKFTIFQHDAKDSTSISSNSLEDITLDQDNNIWAATNGAGIFRLQIDSQEQVNVTKYINETNNSNSLMNNVYCIRVDYNNNVWAGTKDGLFKLSFDDDHSGIPSYTQFVSSSDDKNSLSFDAVYDITFDKSNQMWVGTRDGLNLYLGDNKFKSWTSQNQFPNAVVYTIQEDDNQNLWLGTNDGIVKFDTKHERFSHFDITDGIQDKEFDIQAKFKDQDGNIYLGGIGGVTYFDPSTIKHLDQTAPLYFSQLRVKDRTDKSLRKSDYNIHQLIDLEELKFRYNQFPFYIEYSSIDYRMDKNVDFAYKLLPLDTDWNFLDDQEIQFLNLPSGHYTLQVNGFSRGQEWDQSPIEMSLSVLPPWWKTWWAYALYAALASWLLYSIYRFQLSRKLTIAENSRLSEVNELKSQLYTNITHELRTPLTVILGMAEDIQGELNNDQEKEKFERPIKMITRNGRELLGLINQMLDLAKVESGNLKLNIQQSNIISYLKYIHECFRSMADSKGLAMTFYPEMDELNMDFDKEKLFSITSNLLSNAIKFTPHGGQVIFHVLTKHFDDTEYLVIKVKDTGIGIAPSDLTHVFDRFFQGDGSSTRRGEGTGIGLALTKELTELMKGNIKVISEHGKGSEFIVSLPINNIAPINTDDQIHENNMPIFIRQENPDLEMVADRDIHMESDLPLILVVEDNDDVSSYIIKCLQDHYQLRLAKDGQEGIDMALTLIPDLIISDIMMPKKDGFELCKTLKDDIRSSHIPIIILSAKATHNDRMAGLSKGADAYLIKPFSKAELFVRIKRLIELRLLLRKKYSSRLIPLEAMDKMNNPDDKFIRQIIDAVVANLGNTEYHSIHLARDMHMSESNVYRKLKALTGKSTAIFVRSVRLQKAHEMLESSDLKVSEIAYECGFSDPAWFSRSFKAEYGYTPTALHN